MSSFTIIDVLTVLIALSALVVSFLAYKKTTSIAYGQIELLMSERISQTKNAVQQFSVQMGQIAVKKNQSEEEKRLLKIYEKSYLALIEDNLNAYDDACAKYLDGKVDKKRFEKSYKVSIRNIVETEEFKSFFDPTTSRYKAILKVYKEWEDLEK